MKFLVDCDVAGKSHPHILEFDLEAEDVWKLMDDAGFRDDNVDIYYYRIAYLYLLSLFKTIVVIKSMYFADQTLLDFLKSQDIYTYYLGVINDI